jgi:hypothetical protein
MISNYLDILVALVVLVEVLVVLVVVSAVLVVVLVVRLEHIIYYHHWYIRLDRIKHILLMFHQEKHIYRMDNSILHSKYH